MKDVETDAQFIALTCLVRALIATHPDPIRLSEAARRLLSEAIEDEPDPQRSKHLARMEELYSRVLQELQKPSGGT